jgi:Skp family chaperone for outer membrane proteins
LVLFILAVAISGVLSAQEIRIGYVDMKRLLDNAPQVMAGR